MPMAKAFLYSFLFHASVVAAAFIVPFFFDIFSDPLPVEDKHLIDVEIAGLTETTERRAPNPTPKPEPPPPNPTPKPEPPPKPAAAPEPEPEEQKVAALPPQPREVPESPEPAPVPVPEAAAEPEMPPLPVLPRAKPRPPPKEDEFESMLKDLAEQFEDETPAEDKPEPEVDFLEDLAKSLDTPEREVEPDQPVAQLAPILGNRLTISERDAIARQFEDCWTIPIGARNPEELLVEVRVKLSRDGSVLSSEVVDRRRYSDRFYRAAAESAMRATLNKKCHPVVFPPGKYNEVKDLVLIFNTSKAVGR
jgi:outer membrane biosynthesis protein TonB